MKHNNKKNRNKTKRENTVKIKRKTQGHKTKTIRHARTQTCIMRMAMKKPAKTNNKQRTRNDKNTSNNN